MSIRPLVESGDGYLSKLIKYIPADVQAFYVFASGLISSQPECDQIGYFKLVFIALLVITPLWIFFTISSGTNDKPPLSLRVYQSVIALFAVLIWIYNINVEWVAIFFGHKIPASPLLGSIILGLFTLSVPVLELIFVKQPKL